MKTKLKAFSNLLSADLYKLSKMKSIIIAPILMFVLLLIGYALVWASNASIIDAPEDVIATSIFTSKTALFSAGSSIEIGLFMAIILGIFIGSDFKTGIQKLAIARGANRVQAYFSKWLSAQILTVAFILGAFILSGIISAITGFDEPFTGADFGLLVRSIVLQIWIATSLTSIYTMVAFLIRSQGGTIGASIGLTIISGVIVGILALIGSIKELEWLADLSSFLPSTQLNIASATSTFDTETVLKLTLLPLAYTIISSIIGVITFVKRDIK